jgi:hypothetical protein
MHRGFFFFREKKQRLMIAAPPVNRRERRQPHIARRNENEPKVLRYISIERAFPFCGIMLL